jgi:hypothetical protein
MSRDEKASCWRFDIIFGKKITKELLKTEKVEQHKFVPSSAFTFPLRNEVSIDFAIRTRFKIDLKFGKFNSKASTLFLTTYQVIILPCQETPPCIQRDHFL